jgi:hypothetical protein
MSFSSLNNAVIKVNKLSYGLHNISDIRVNKNTKFLAKKFLDNDKNPLSTVTEEDYKTVLTITFKGKGGEYEHICYEPREFKEDGTPNKLFPKTFMEIKYIYSKVKSIDFEDADILVNTWSELCDFAVANLTVKGLNLQIKLVPELGNDGKYYPKFITWSPKGGIGAWGMGWLHNLAFEKPIYLSKKEAKDIEDANKKEQGNQPKQLAEGEEEGTTSTEEEPLPF